jgi:hypothetical protein
MRRVALRSRIPSKRWQSGGTSRQIQKSTPLQNH